MDSDSDSDRSPPSAGRNAPKQKSRRPPNTAFRQQRLKAWQPILTPKTVLPVFFIITIIFAPIGGLLLYASNQVQEITLDYTNCISASSDLADMPDDAVSYHFKGGAEPGQKPRWSVSTSDDANVTPNCTLEFEIPTDMGHPVFMFYRLTNFYQNHRRYVQSFNEDQLNGKPVTNSSLKSKDDCKPLTLDPNGKAYYPCGLIANSYFNDTFSAPILLNPTNGMSTQTYNMTDEGIAWATDRNRFKKTEYTNDQVVPPPNWAKMYPDGYTDENPIPDISTWESFQNWMRTAGLPTFSKLALRNDNETLVSGTYSVTIGLNFDVREFDGTKSLVLSTRTVIGGRNPFLGIAYLVVAGLCLVLGIFFLIKHLVHPRKIGDHSYLSWNNEQQSGTAAAVATGRDDASAVQRR